MLLKNVKEYLLQLNVGDKLPDELTLCKQFNVSRGTIREVVNHLRFLGVLERSTKTGTFVKSPGINEISETLAFQLQIAGFGFEELKAMRLFLETSQIPLLIQLVTPLAIDSLNSLVDQMETAVSDPEHADQLDMQFHLALIEICGNRILMIFSQVIALMFAKKYRQKFLNAQAVKKSVKDHREMIKYLKEGDSALLTELVKNHLEPL